MPKTDAVGNDIAFFECGEGFTKECDIEVLAAHCNSNPSCQGFNTNGLLKSCTSGCHSHCCYDVTDNVDLYIRKGYLPPNDWQNDVNNGKILFANPEPHFCFLPEIANGYIGTIAMSASVFQSGLFNGKCGSIGKTRIPSPIGGSIVTGELIASGLHFEKGLFARRYQLNDQNGSIIEHRVFVSRNLKSIMVLEFSIVSSILKSVKFSFSPTFDPLNQTHNPEIVCNGGTGVQVDIEFTFNPNLSTSTMNVYEGTLLTRDDYGRVQYVTICTQQPNETMQISSSSTLQFISSLASSIDFGSDPINQTTITREAINRFDEALSKRHDLFTEHIQAWSDLWKSGIDIQPLDNQSSKILFDTNNDGENDTIITTFSRALDIAQHVNSSMYYLLSSSRDDWPNGISPGGLASQSYSGVMFFDMDWYMMPAMLPFYPSHADNILRYRYNSLAESEKTAKVFGYNGSMFAWTAGYLGRPQGCCDGKGGWEDCIEQHITGDVAVAVQMYYHATQDRVWLENIGWPLLRDIARFWASRVTKTDDMTYSINKVMPVDEWCDNDQSKCGDIGVNNAIQTNAVAAVSLAFAAKVGNMFGFDIDPLWEIIANKLKINFNSTTQTHIQWDNALPPTPHHYVCPEDVLYLTYPMNFNVTPQITRNDAEIFIPITCQENAGMTGPIHAIVWTMLNESFKAEGEFNRSLQACTYGEFHVRNEVDMHPDIIGGHGFNTHFLTGDGGFIQSVMMGYAGLRFDDKSLLLNPPPGLLTPSTSSIRLRNLLVQGTYPFDYTVDQISMNFITSDIYTNLLCITDNHSGQWKITNNSLKLNFQNIVLPIRINLCN